MANGLTAVRFLLAVPAGLLLGSSNATVAPYAAGAIIVAILTDLVDGPVARRSGTASAFGGIFDHTTDCVFVVSTMVGGASRGVIPWMLPVLVVAAFSQYVIDSYWLHRQLRLRGSNLGRYNGILYFVPACGDTLVRLGLTFLRPAVSLVCWLLIASTCVSIAQRAIAVRGTRQTTDESLAAGTAARLPQ
jgi:phosphatidylglycerophosphate synthase